MHCQKPLCSALNQICVQVCLYHTLSFVRLDNLYMAPRRCFGPPIGGFPPIFHEFPTPLRSVQICQDNGCIYEGVGLLERVKIRRNQSKMASFSPTNALSEQSLGTPSLSIYQYVNNIEETLLMLI